jgi:hypothetical protein
MTGTDLLLRVIPRECPYQSISAAGVWCLTLADVTGTSNKLKKQLDL